MTLIVLLILAAVSLNAVLSEKGIFNKAETAGAKYNEAKAREVLETVLLADGQYEKNINPEYNQNGFLNKLIINEIPGTEIKGDVAIVSGWAFELDRTVPKIGRALGRADKLVFPTVNATVELATDKKNATINITAKEEKNGINKIEIWLLGEKIKEYTYDSVKTEITVTPPYIVTQNGEYTIKAYGDLMASTTVEVSGIIPGIEFEPNGNTTWEKEHSTKIKVQETEEKIKTMKYQWTNSVKEPEDNTFTQECKDGDTITGKGNNMTGQYYLWILLETENGATAKRRSEAFNFDNEGPTITNFTAEKYSETGITLSATAQDTKSGIVKFEFYIDGSLKSAYTQTITATTSSVTKTVNITGLTTGNHTCMVKVYDAKNNSNTSSKSGTTKLYTWEKREAKQAIWRNTWTEVNNAITFSYNGRSPTTGSSTGYLYKNCSFDSATGKFTLTGRTSVRHDNATNYYGFGSNNGVNSTYTSGDVVVQLTKHFIADTSATMSGYRYRYTTVTKIQDEWIASSGELIYEKSRNAHEDNKIINGYIYYYKGIN